MAAFKSPWIPEAIASVIAQTHLRWELLVLDDADLASTRQFVDGLGEARVRYVANQATLGPALNHQKGLALARYDLVACINHDDIWEPTLLAELVSAICQEPNAVVAFADHWVMDASGQVDAGQSEAFSRKWGRTDLREGLHRPFTDLAIIDRAVPIAQCAVWRRDAVPAIPAWAGDRYDYWIQTRLALTGAGAVYVPRRLARFRLHEGNLGGSPTWSRRAQAVRFSHRLLRTVEAGPLRSHLMATRRRALVHAAKWPASRVRTIARRLIRSGR